MTDVAILKHIAQQWIEAGWQNRDFAKLDELHAPDFIDHDPAGRASDRASFKQGIIDLYAAFPDFHTEIEALLVDESRQAVTIRWIAQGTHKGVFMNIAPTHKRIQFKGIEILHIQGQHITARWGEWDGIDLLEQLGALHLS